MNQSMAWKKRILLFCLMCFSALAFASQPLTPDQAFQVSVKTTPDQHQVITQWSVAPGYHLYASKLNFQFNPAIPFEITKPTPLPNDYYEGQFNITLKTLAKQSGVYVLALHYQGCASAGFCYPPMQKTVMVSLAEGEAVSNTHFYSGLLTNQFSVQTVLRHHATATLLLIFFGIGFLLAFTPCVLPMIPIITGLIVGQKQQASTKRSFLLSVTYVMGMSTAYALAGLLAALAGSSLQVWVQQPLFVFLGGVLFLLLALSLFEFYNLPLSPRWQSLVHRWSMKHKGGTFVGVFMMGFIATLMVSPCVTAPLVGVLMYIGQTGDVWLGTMALFMIGLGMGVPLIAVGMSAGRFLPKSGAWMEVVTKLFGLLMLAMAIWLFARLMPQWLTHLAWGAYLVAVILFFVRYFPRKLMKKWGHYRLALAALLLLTLLFMMGGLRSAASFIEQALGVEATLPEQASKPLFQVIPDLKALQQALTKAKAQNKPVLLDFYADWCESCVEMDKTVFDLQAVQDALRQFVLMRVDMSKHTPAIEQLTKAYNVIAPPTLIFLNKQGDEVDSRRRVGSVSATEFLNDLNRFMSASCDENSQC